MVRVIGGVAVRRIRSGIVGWFGVLVKGRVAIVGVVVLVVGVVVVVVVVVYGGSDSGSDSGDVSGSGGNGMRR